MSNRQKKKLLIVQSVQADMVGLYRPYDDMVGPYRLYDDVSSGDMEDANWQVWSNGCLTRVHWWLMVC
jgi:hypothetical protein